MSLADAISGEVNNEDLGVKTWNCNGVVYKIPLLCGDMEMQKDLLEIADKYDSAISGSPSEIAVILGEFMWQLLKLKNDVDEKTARSIANKSTLETVFAIWLGN